MKILKNSAYLVAATMFTTLANAKTIPTKNALALKIEIESAKAHSCPGQYDLVSDNLYEVVAGSRLITGVEIKHDTKRADARQELVSQLVATVDPQTGAEIERVFDILNRKPSYNCLSFGKSTGEIFLGLEAFIGNDSLDLKIPAQTVIKKIIYLNPQGADNDQNDDLSKPEYSIELGDQGDTVFASKLTLYKPANQPKCVGCVSLAAIYDGNKVGVGSTRISQIKYSIDDPSCTLSHGDATLEVLDSENSESAVEFKTVLHLNGNKPLCLKSQLKIELLAKKCMNPTVKHCRLLETREEYEVSLDDVLKLRESTQP